MILKNQADGTIILTMQWTHVLVIIIVCITFYVFLTYNALVRWRVRVKEAFSQLDVQLKRRYDLIPNLVETVKGYMKHERELLEKIAELRTRAISVTDMKEKGSIEGSISNIIKRILVIVENYPELKASQNFMILQEEIISTENRIAYARQYYNDCVRRLNTLCLSFPSNLVAKMFGFKLESFLEFPQERGGVRVEF
ncbi:MAG: LemA family protein [candidate division WOR-3 bacterium]